MTQFTIAEDFPESEIEFEERFSNERTCHDYLAKMKRPHGFVSRKCGHRQYWVSARDLYAL